VANQFCDEVVQEAVGTKVIESLHPSQQMIEIVYQHLINLMGPVDTHIMYVQPAPTIIMMCGLQGSGKTTTCGKLAAYLKKKGKSVMLAACDLQRPAAVDQLQTLVNQVEADVSGGGVVRFYGEPERCSEYGKAVGVAVKVARNAVKAARQANVDVLILDTAGRLHINDDLMDELRQINRALNPHQIYLTIDAMTGQDAVNSAKAFNEQLELDGVILSKTDSDTRGGAALSVKAVTGKPLKFIGTGEKITDLDEFHPEGMADRILGMGDVRALVRKAQDQIDQDEAEKLQEKMASGKMNMEDFLQQLRSIRKMGSLKSLVGMIPGVGKQLKDLDLDDKQFDHTEAMIQSMTEDERGDVDLLNASRRRRIAKGSGTQPEDVGQLVKSFDMVSNMTKQMAGMSMMQRMKAITGMGGGDLSAFGSSSGPRYKTKQRSKRRRKSRKRKSR
ncbi:MAG: signal recognition particle protein, partial [Phycisphaeraceae bacterium]|nr:signal recognition particle protein [Phycisphaeraceae bacterium]